MFHFPIPSAHTIIFSAIVGINVSAIIIEIIGKQAVVLIELVPVVITAVMTSRSGMLMEIYQERIIGSGRLIIILHCSGLGRRICGCGRRTLFLAPDQGYEQRKSKNEKKAEYQIKFSESEANLRKVLDQNF